MTQDAATEPETAALVEEACRKSSLLWVTVPGERSRAVWHVWHEGGVYLVVGGIEQSLPGVDTASEVEVTVRSKDKWTRLAAWRAAVSRVAPGSEEWDSAVPVLHAKRLNAPDGEDQPQRWARESLVVRLASTGSVTESPGAMSTGSHAAPPPPTPATTESPLPPRVGRRPGRR